MKIYQVLLTVLLLSVSTARAHETRPAYLEIQELKTGEYRVLWKRPILGEVALPRSFVGERRCPANSTPPGGLEARFAPTVPEDAATFGGAEDMPNP